MENKSKRIGLSMILVIIIVALAINSFALCLPYAVQGQVFYENLTSTDGELVTVKNLNTGETITDVVGTGRANKESWYYADLGNLPNCFSQGDTIEISSGKEKKNLIVDNKGGRVVETIYLSEKIEFLLNLSEGWNLISFPLNLIDKTLPAPLKSIEGNYSCLFTYKNSTWHSYCAGDPPNSDKYLTPTVGFWINMTNDDVLEVEGFDASSVDAKLTNGWNLVGYQFLEEYNVTDLVDESVKMVYMYNGSWSSYVQGRAFNSLEILKPGYGYWVKLQ